MNVFTSCASTPPPAVTGLHTEKYIILISAKTYLGDSHIVMFNELSIAVTTNSINSLTNWECNIGILKQFSVFKYIPIMHLYVCWGEHHICNIKEHISLHILLVMGSSVSIILTPVTCISYRSEAVYGPLYILYLINDHSLCLQMHCTWEHLVEVYSPSFLKHC